MAEAPIFREECDSLGSVQVPADAYYGAQTARAIQNFPVSGKRPARAFIWSVAAIKYAAASVNSTLGLLEPELADAIAAAAEEVMEGRWDAHIVVDPFQAGAGTSHHMNVNEVIANRASLLLGAELGEYRIHPNDHVNQSQSTNDVIPTAIRLGALRRAGQLLAVVDDLSDALQQKAEEFDGVLKSARTHLQDAVPMRLGQEFSGYAASVRRDAERIRRTAGMLRRLGIGGTAAATGLNAPPSYAMKMVAALEDITGLELELSDNTFESMQSMADMAEFSGSLRILAMTLTRIANDLRLLSSGPMTGLNEIQLPAVQPGSSIMPGKVNPVMAEMVNMAMFHLMGCDAAIALAVQAGQLELNVMMPLIAYELFEMLDVAEGAIGVFTERCVRGIRANPQQARFWLERNPVIATVLSPLIGYEAVAALVQQAYSEGRPIAEIVREVAQAGRLHAHSDGRALSASEVEAAMHDLYMLTGGELPPAR